MVIGGDGLWTWLWHSNNYNKSNVIAFYMAFYNYTSPEHEVSRIHVSLSLSLPSLLLMFYPVSTSKHLVSTFAFFLIMIHYLPAKMAGEMAREMAREMAYSF
jgi:hypothetical protein